MGKNRYEVVRAHDCGGGVYSLPVDTGGGDPGTREYSRLTGTGVSVDDITGLGLTGCAEVCLDDIENCIIVVLPTQIMNDITDCRGNDARVVDA